MNTPTQTPIHRGLRTGRQPQSNHDPVNAKVDPSNLCVAAAIVTAITALCSLGLWKLGELIFK